MDTTGLSHSMSFSSIASTATTKSSASVKRTRKRFTKEQIIILERLFDKNSHPTREQRESVSKKTGMDLKSVTIWFQNKRQSERKIALQNMTNFSNRTNINDTPFPRTIYPNVQGHLIPSTNIVQGFQRSQSFTAAPSSISTQSRASSGFFSLDHIASRTELAPSPRTPVKFTRHASYHGFSSVWEVMPSSPPHPELSISSPFSKDIIDFATNRPGKANKRTLEWACAAARLAEKSNGGRELNTPERNVEILMTVDSEDRTDCDDTEEESQEPLTPEASQDSIHWNDSPLTDDTRVISVKKANVTCDTKAVEDDIMDAAWALCGLSRS